jgi:hypothetical protein
MAITDVFLLKSLISAAGKVAGKVGGGIVGREAAKEIAETALKDAVIAVEKTVALQTERVAAESALAAAKALRNKAVTATERVAANQAVGKAAERVVRNQLEARGCEILGTHVTITTTKGPRVVDFLVKTPSGKTLIVEVKSGNAVRSTAQKAKDALIATEGGVMVGENAPKALRRTRVILRTIVVRVR